jgi:2',3'-cyclic-nucleotide 2'-phosphodiesterase (5'-nucleotidase family)
MKNVKLAVSNFLMQRLLLPIGILFLFIVACNHKSHVTGITPGYAEMNATVAQTDSATHALLEPYKLKLDSVMNVVVGQTAFALPNEKGKTETLLGNFVADACLAQGNLAYKPADGKPAQVCILNNGGLRASLPAGNVTRGNVFELMPFDNEIVVVTISGAKMWDLVKFAAASGGVPIAGMNIGMKPDKTPGTILIGGVPFDSTKTYKVMTSDYLANGGDKMAFLKEPISNEKTGYLIRTAILDTFTEAQKAGKAVAPVTDRRMHYEN